MKKFTKKKPYYNPNSRMGGRLHVIWGRKPRNGK